MTPEQVLRRTPKTIRVSVRHAPSLHYLLLIDEEPFGDALQFEDTTRWEQAMDDRMSWISSFQNCVAPSSIEVEYVVIAEAEYVPIAKAGKKMMSMTDYLRRIRQEATREDFSCR